MVKGGSPASVLVVGAGFFGISLALELGRRGYHVTVLDREEGPLRRASYFNQARVHSGPHYPRSLMTAVRSRENFSRFCEDFSPAIYSSFENIYMVGAQYSKVSARQFYNFMTRAGVTLSPVWDSILPLIFPQRIEGAWVVEEVCFDAAKLAQELMGRLAESSVKVMFGQEVTSLTYSEGFHVGTPDFSGDFDWVFNCTYSALNTLPTLLGIPLLPLRHELTEMALVRVPESLRGKSFTMMCGPFFSLMPFPARGDLYTLSHVRYTPHFSWEEGEGKPARSPGEMDVLRGSRTSNFEFMRADAARYMPVLRGLEQVDSLWEVKTLLPRSDLDDGRPILFRQDVAIPRLVHVLGGKLDNVYDAILGLNSLGI